MESVPDLMVSWPDGVLTNPELRASLVPAGETLFDVNRIGLNLTIVEELGSSR